MLFLYRRLALYVLVYACMTDTRVVWQLIGCRLLQLVYQHTDELPNKVFVKNVKIRYINRR